MKRIFSFLLSMQFMALLITVFGVSIAVATFIENDFGTNSAKSVVYNAAWFEILLVLLIINLIGAIVNYKFYTRKKITIFIFHIAFIVIILGAAITRYFGFEGIMHIREGKSSNKIMSDELFVYFEVQKNNAKEFETKKVLFSELSKKSLKGSIEIGDEKLKYQSVDFIPRAEPTIENLSDGVPMMHIVYSTMGRRENLILTTGEMKFINNVSIGFNNDVETDVKVQFSDSGLVFLSSLPLQMMQMATQKTTSLDTGIYHRFLPTTVYSVNGNSIVLKQFAPVGRITYSPSGEKDADLPDVVKVKLTYKGYEKDYYVSGSKGRMGNPVKVDLNDITVKMGYGSRAILLPFEIELIDFVLDRYPGSQSPASFASKVILRDAEQDIYQQKVVSMNNVLKHRGYRFYQSSYDGDENGTVFSVNFDFAGTFVTYLGYFLLALGMITSIFNKSSRFQNVSKLKLLVSFLGLFFLASATNTAFASDLDGNDLKVIPVEHTRKFSSLLVQDTDGRIKPVNTLSSELLRKVHRKNSYKDLNPDQVFLGMMSNPHAWQKEPLIKISNAELRDMLQIDGKYAAFTDFFSFDSTGSSYVIHDAVEKVYRKKSSERSKFENEIIKVDERVNICYMVYMGNFFKVLPLPNDPTNTWYSYSNIPETAKIEDSIEIKNIVVSYFMELSNSLQTGNWKETGTLLDILHLYQQKIGGNVIPSEKKQKLEIFYNKADIFKRLSSLYGLFGFLLLILAFIKELSHKQRREILINITVYIIYGLFAFHALGLGLRWYISGHAPWSNGYEALVYISWTAMLAGVIFSRKSIFSLATTSILAFIILSVALLSWLDPEITTLVPVLKSYWLTIHVSVITSSYGFLGMSAMLAFVNLVLMISKTKNNYKRLEESIFKISSIAEMSIILGLYLLTIGTFLGGVWANESWGRYWGWDPKETWALVTVLVYAFIAHIRFIPSLNNLYNFNLFSLIGYGSVIMTYFGVNYYLAGLHSYAKGDSFPIPVFVFYTLGIIIVISLLAYLNNRKLEKIK